MKKLLVLLILSLLMISTVWGQETTIHSNACASATTNWTYTNNVLTKAIQQSGYWLLEAGNPSDIIVSETFNTSTYTGGVKLSFSLATYDSGTNNPCKVEYSTDGGATYSSTVFTSSTPSSSSYIDSGVWDLAGVSSTQLKFRFRNNGTSGRGVRLDNILIVGYMTSPMITVSPTSLTGLTYMVGNGPSTSQSFTVSGSYLTNSIVLTPPQ